jgi:5-methylcytosine-specific restriction endonuclease McrA
MAKPSKAKTDDHFTYQPPPEARHEYRVPVGHSWSEWKFLQAKYNYRCAYCGIRKEDTPEQYLTRDHYRPIRYGGCDHIHNIVPACKQCNFLKGNLWPVPVTVPTAKPRRRYRAWTL